MSKRPPKGSISQKDLLAIYRSQEATREKRRVMNKEEEDLKKAGDTLIDAVQKKKLDIEEGPVKPNITKVIRRVPHYKQEAADLAATYLQKDPEVYWEECRNRGGRCSYFRWKLKIVE